MTPSFGAVGHAKSAPVIFFETVAASDTDEILVAAVAGRRILLLQLLAVSDDETTITLKSKGAGAGTDISPDIPHAGGAGIATGEVLPPSPYGWCVTNPGEALAVDTSAGGATALLGAYVLV